MSKPQISTRAELMPSSPIRKLFPLAEAAEQRGIKIYKLNIGQPDLPSPEEGLEALKHVTRKVLEYSPSDGFRSLREKLVAYYDQYQIKVSADDIIITTGGSEAVLFAFLACLNPGDEIIVPEPAYANYMAFAISAGAVIKPIVSTIDDGFALPPIDDLEKLITPRTKGILICNPNNPTGYLYTKEELQSLAQLAKKHDLFLFADEVYREFCYDGKKHFSVMELEEISNNVILLDSVSKRYSACGARVGVIISKNKEVMTAALRMGQARLCPPYFGQIFAEAAIDTPQEYFDKVAAEYDSRRRTLVNAVNQIPGCRCPMPTGAFYSIIEMPIDDSDKFCEWLLKDFTYNGATVMLAPATGFYSDPEKGRKQARMAYVLKEEDLKAAVKCLEEALKVYPGRTI